MRAARREAQALGTLAAMPFLDRLELAAVCGFAERTAHRVLQGLRGDGLVESVRHAAPLTAATRRWRLTPAGLRRLAHQQETSLTRVLRLYPATGHWQRLLLYRLDAVAVIYRLAAAVATAAGSLEFQWYRADPLDAGMVLPGGKTLGVIRRGATMDRTAFFHRVGRLLDPQRDRPRTLLALLPDDVRLLQARRLLARYPGSAYLATEHDVAHALADDAVWRGPVARTPLTLRSILDGAAPGGILPVEPPPSRLSWPDPVGPSAFDDLPDHLLPAALRPADKRMLDAVANWPFITAADLGGILGLSPSAVSRTCARLSRLGLVATPSLHGQRRLALSQGGLLFLARRDRVSLGGSLRRWNVESPAGDSPDCWRQVPGTRSRPLARTVEHTRAVHGFMADLLRQANRMPRCRVVQVSPPHHSARYFPHRGRLRSVHPDGFGVVRVGAKTIPLYLGVGV